MSPATEVPYLSMGCHVRIQRYVLLCSLYRSHEHDTEY